MSEEFIYSDPEDVEPRGVSTSTHPYQGSQMDAGFDFLAEEISQLSKDKKDGRADTAMIATSPARSPRVRSKKALQLLAKGKVAQSVPPAPTNASDDRFGLLQTQIDQISAQQTAQFQRLLEVMGERKRGRSPQERSSTSTKRKRYLRTDTSPRSSSVFADSSEGEALSGTTCVHDSAILPRRTAAPSPSANHVQQASLGNEVSSLLADDVPPLDTSADILQEFFPHKRDDVEERPPFT